MKEQYYNQLVGSFITFLDHEVLYNGEAFNNFSGQLYSTQDPRFSNHTVFGSPFRQWVADDSVEDAAIPSGVFLNGDFVERGVSGLAIDFGNGRVLFDGSVPSNSNVTVEYAPKDFNLYYTNRDDVDLLFNTQFEFRPRFNQTQRALDYQSQPVPAIFVRNMHGNNEPFAFGGEDLTNYEMRATVIANTTYQLDAVVSLMQDLNNKCFPLLSATDLPFNIFGDVKSGDFYNYFDLIPHANGKVYIDKVTTSRFSESDNKQINSRIWGAFVDFRVEQVRFPRKN